MSEKPITSIMLVNTGFATGPVLIRATYLMQRLHDGQLVPMPLTLTSPAGLVALEQEEPQP